MSKARGPRHGRWKGGRRKGNGGYPLLLLPEHPRADKAGYVREHILVVEKAMGRTLPLGAEVHHVNEVTDDNRNGNLVVCSHAYHALLHQRMRALRDCGDANKRKCVHCKVYDDTKNLGISKNHIYHRSCAAANARRKCRIRREALGPHGLRLRRQAAVQKAWETKRTRYGPKGHR